MTDPSRCFRCTVLSMMYAATAVVGNATTVLAATSIRRVICYLPARRRTLVKSVSKSGSPGF
jgi:hypothetical protein